jgi:hypothetical protein
VAPQVRGAHLRWFKRVLKAANQKPGVDHIMVQGHVPAMPPVRAESTSLMMMDGYTQSKLWQAMRAHDVDLYFAGEIHATSLIKDRQSDLVQVVTDRERPVEITVYPDKLELVMFNRSLNSNGKVRSDRYYQNHRVTLDYSSGQLTVPEGRGVLAPLDTQALFIHYPFNAKQPTRLGSRDYGVPTNIDNPAALDYVYDARASKARLIKQGMLGKGITLKRGGAIDTQGVGPFGLFETTARTLGVFFKTDKAGRHPLISASNKRKSQKLSLLLDDGRPALRTSAGLLHGQADGLNDGQWHQLVFSIAPDAATVADVQLYVDGQPCPWARDVDRDAKLTTQLQKYVVAIGAPPRDTWQHRKPNTDHAPFPGRLDEFAAWYRALRPAKVQAIYELATRLKLNASQSARLLSLHRQGAGSVTIGGQAWQYADDLTGRPGVPRQAGDQWIMPLNENGTGVRTR